MENFALAARYFGLDFIRMYGDECGCSVPIDMEWKWVYGREGYAYYYTERCKNCGLLVKARQLKDNAN